MAKKKEAKPQQPIISSIPVPPSDSALVIDLPDGQKLLVGKIETGTVIEVATWRGTGRPDSRTNRLMLGMSNENETKLPEVESEENTLKINNLKFPENLLILIKMFLAKLGVLGLRTLQKLKQLDFKQVNLGKIRISKLDFRTKRKEPKTQSTLSAKTDADFEADFKRILEEVAQRRDEKKIKSPSRTLPTGTSGVTKLRNSKSSQKKSRKKAQ